MKKHLLIVGIIFLFILSSVSPLVFGFNIVSKEQTTTDNFNRHLYPEFYDPSNAEKINEYVEYQNTDISVYYENSKPLETNPEEPIQPLDGPMDSAWPMHGYDVRHTGRSPYSTAGNLGEEKWWFYNESFIEGSPVIDNDGVIYFGGWSNHLYALYPNGNLKWKSNIEGNVETSPAIAEDGTIYVGTHFSLAYGTFLFAINPDGTRKWKYKTGNMYSSPTIGEDGTVYCSNGGSGIIALYPNNGSLKWKYSTGSSVLSSPAIGDDGTIFCGSNDDHLYALYPNNGSLKWKYDTGSWVHGIPAIADDGTVYCGSDNGYMYAFYPNNGTMIWRFMIGAVWGSPALDKDSNLYVGVWEKKFYSISPNGSIRWSVNLSRRVWGMSAVISDDGTIYFGTSDFEGHDGGNFHALNPDGTIKYILYHTRMFWASPAIGEDGTVYICTRKDRLQGLGQGSTGYLRAFGKLDPDAPTESSIDGFNEILPFVEYRFKFRATSPLDNDLYYWIEWGDKGITGWIGPYRSGEIVTVKHQWESLASVIRVKCKDSDNLWGPWGEFDIQIKSRDKNMMSSLFLQFLERYPLFNLLLQRLTLSL